MPNWRMALPNWVGVVLSDLSASFGCEPVVAAAVGVEQNSP